jgi:lipopolysaccharide export system permease protein
MILLKTLDRYVIRSFLFSYGVSLLVMITLSVVIEAFLRLDDFMEAARSLSPSFGVFTLMFQYYTVRLPIMFHVLSPAVLLVGAMFTIGQLNRHNELLAMRAAGISVYRTIAPIFMMTVILTGILVADQELLIPSLITPIQEAEDMLNGNESNVYKNLTIRDGNENEFKVARYLVFERKMERDVKIVSYYKGSSDKRLMVKAKSCAWQRCPDGKDRWVLSDGHIYAYDTQKNEIPPKQWDVEPDFKKEGYVLLRADDPAPKSFFQIQTSLTHEDMKPTNDDIMVWQSTGQIMEHLKASPTSSNLSVALHRRIAFPLSNLVLLMLGLPFVLGGEGRSTFVGLGICIIICATFYGISILCTELGGKAVLSPPAAAWLPTVLFLPMGLLLFDGVKT